MFNVPTVTLAPPSTNRPPLLSAFNVPRRYVPDWPESMKTPGPSCVLKVTPLKLKSPAVVVAPDQLENSRTALPGVCDVTDPAPRNTDVPRGRSESRTPS